MDSFPFLFFCLLTVYWCYFVCFFSQADFSQYVDAFLFFFWNIFLFIDFIYICLCFLFKCFFVFFFSFIYYTITLKFSTDVNKNLNRKRIYSRKNISKQVNSHNGAGWHFVKKEIVQSPIHQIFLISIIKK